MCFICSTSHSCLVYHWSTLTRKSKPTLVSLMLYPGRMRMSSGQSMGAHFGQTLPSLGESHYSVMFDQIQLLGRNIHIFLPFRSCVKYPGLKTLAVGHMIVWYQWQCHVYPWWPCVIASQWVFTCDVIPSLSEGIFNEWGSNMDYITSCDEATTMFTLKIYSIIYQIKINTFNGNTFIKDITG